MKKNRKLAALFAVVAVLVAWQANAQLADDLELISQMGLMDGWTKATNCGDSGKLFLIEGETGIALLMAKHVYTGTYVFRELSAEEVSHEAYQSYMYGKHGYPVAASAAGEDLATFPAQAQKDLATFRKPYIRVFLVEHFHIRW